MFSHREKYTLGIHQKSTLRLHWTHGSDEWDRALVGIKILSSHIPQQRVAYSMGTDYYLTTTVKSLESLALQEVPA